MDIGELFSERINLPQIRETVAWAAGKREHLERIWELARSGDRQTSANALWVMTHLPDSDREWVSSLRNEMIDRLLTETDTGKKRMLLKILREQDYSAEDIRTDFLDFCLSKINSECEPYAIRCFSIYAAFKMCRHFPELLAELESHLDMMSIQVLSPGLKSALRQTKAKIKKLGKATSGTASDSQICSGR